MFFYDTYAIYVLIFMKFSNWRIGKNKIFPNKRMHKKKIFCILDRIVLIAVITDLNVGIQKYIVSSHSKRKLDIMH